MKTKFALCAMIVCITSVVAAGQQVSVNYNHSQSFAGFHTYAWGGNNQSQIQNSILAQVAQQDIDSALQAKGFQKVQESQNPDLIVLASGGMRQQTSWSAWGMRGIGGGMGGISPQQNVEGTLIVDLHDTLDRSHGRLEARYKLGNIRGDQNLELNLIAIAIATTRRQHTMFRNIRFATLILVFLNCAWPLQAPRWAT
jgi:hypothetical protein